MKNIIKTPIIDVKSDFLSILLIYKRHDGIIININIIKLISNFHPILPKKDSDKNCDVYIYIYPPNVLIIPPIVL